MVRDRMVKEAKKAGKNVTVEQRWKPHRIDENVPYDVHVHGVPGDMALPVYFDDGRLDTEGLFDFVVGNVCAPSHKKSAAKHKLHVARKKEKEKHSKYDNHPNVIPCALETFGGMGEEFHYLLSFIADAQATRRSTAYSVVMARLRANVIGTLWKYNVRMFMSCVAL